MNANSIELPWVLPKQRCLAGVDSFEKYSEVFVFLPEKTKIVAKF